jgi:hypothetical protein
MQSLRVNKDGVSASSEKQRLISMAQTAYEEAGMWAVKAITEEYSYGAHRQKYIKPVKNKHKGRLYENKSRNVSVFKLRVTH